MTDEQIRKLAETYANNLFRWPNLESGNDRECYVKGFIEGVHSRDEEIEQLKKELLSAAKQAMAKLANCIIKNEN